MGGLRYFGILKQVSVGALLSIVGPCCKGGLYCNNPTVGAQAEDWLECKVDFLRDFIQFDLVYS